MAGSQADFKYIDNNNRAWLLRIDKSNALTIGTGFSPITQSDMKLDYLPRNIEPRYVIATHPTRAIKRKIFCQSIDSEIWKANQKTINLIDYQDRKNQEFNIKQRIEEREVYTAKLKDTYQNDN